MNTCKYSLKTAIYALPAVFAAACCLAQQTQPAISFVGGYGYGSDDEGYLPYVNNRALTPGESYARGLSDVIRSQGAYNLMTSKAAINASEAVKNDIQNREQWTNTYFQMRRDNRVARAEERGPRPAAEDLVRYAQMNKLKPLGANQLDAVSGKIYWPRSLRTDQFASSRGELDELFAKRARYGDISMEELMKIRAEINKMVNQLNQQIRDIPSIEYTTAKHFLVCLANEVQLVVG